MPFLVSHASAAAHDDAVGDSTGEAVADVGLGDGVAEGVAGCLASAIAFSSAATVAASTSPVGLTPSSVWKAFTASVRAGVHSPSTGPSQ